jgi:cell division protein FtsI (penicillin-binding protein 3)
VKARVKPMTPGVPRPARIRAHVAVLVISLGLFGLVWRAWALQIDDNDHYRELATRQHALVVDIPAPRGDIRDAVGRPLAISADADSIWANPHEIHDVAATAEKLATLMEVDAATLEGKLAGDRRFVWIARHVKPELAAAVRAAALAGIPGVYVAREPRRWYPARAIGGPVIGRADIDGNGLDGIELSLNTALTGTRGAGHAVRDARGRRMFADGLAQPEPGATVTLTIDTTIQAIAETALADGIAAQKAKGGVAVVLEVQTGRALALASYPTSNPNIAGGAARDKAVNDAYEAGSVMKVFSVSAALDAGVVTPETEFDLNNGSIQIGTSKPIRDVHPDKYLTVAGIIKRSSNVGAVQIAQRLGKDKLHDGLVRFGFGTRTGIELPGEQAGTLRPAKKWREIEQATISFGYGLTVTPLQIAAALAAIGNDGIYNAPRIIADITDPDGKSIFTSALEPRRVLSAKTAAQMRTMLATVFEAGKQAGTAHNIVVPGFRCGGKTGTANKYDPETKHYSLDHYLASFAGLAPIANPRLAVIVIVDDPSGLDHYGGSVSGPIFARIASETLRYLGVPGESLVCPPPSHDPPPAIIPPKTCVAPGTQPFSVGDSPTEGVAAPPP